MPTAAHGGTDDAAASALDDAAEDGGRPHSVISSPKAVGAKPTQPKAPPPRHLIQGQIDKSFETAALRAEVAKFCSAYKLGDVIRTVLNQLPPTDAEEVVRRDYKKQRTTGLEDWRKDVCATLNLKLMKRNMPLIKLEVLPSLGEAQDGRTEARPTKFSEVPAVAVTTRMWNEVPQRFWKNSFVQDRFSFVIHGEATIERALEFLKTNNLDEDCFLLLRMLNTAPVEKLIASFSRAPEERPAATKARFLAVIEKEDSCLRTRIPEVTRSSDSLPAEGKKASAEANDAAGKAGDSLESGSDGKAVATEKADKPLPEKPSKADKSEADKTQKADADASTRGNSAGNPAKAPPHPMYGYPPHPGYGWPHWGVPHWGMPGMPVMNPQYMAMMAHEKQRKKEKKDKKDKQKGKENKEKEVKKTATKEVRKSKAQSSSSKAKSKKKSSSSSSDSSSSDSADTKVRKAIEGPTGAELEAELARPLPSLEYLVNRAERFIEIAKKYKQDVIRLGLRQAPRTAKASGASAPEQDAKRHKAEAEPQNCNMTRPKAPEVAPRPKVALPQKLAPKADLPKPVEARASSSTRKENVTLMEWLEKADQSGKGALLQYFDTIKEKIGPDPSFLKRFKLASPSKPGILGEVDASFWQICRTTTTGHKLWLAKAIAAL
eukprot:TRINITY_DN1485_c0_g1_i1.p1 TRINITY_DN1485_c0_g1~~TRINITY_DN1485_c0_g1_i1.p1  ORF type:complete len:661 (-),score=142.09 TRINITY_DN1485_c0_g1_i1:322-2304(-)